MHARCDTPVPTPVPSIVDTTKYTDVVLMNSSKLDSVQVFVTLPSTQSIVGKFGMDSTNFIDGFVTVRAIERVALTNYLPNAFVNGSFASGITSLETP